MTITLPKGAVEAAAIAMNNVSAERGGKPDCSKRMACAAFTAAIDWMIANGMARKAMLGTGANDAWWQAQSHAEPPQNPIGKPCIIIKTGEL
jgi:hypothetical protein